MPERVASRAARCGRTGVGAEALETRVLFAGDVSVFVDDAGNLIVVGDGAANCIQLDMFGSFTVLGCDHGGAPTTVNGVPNGQAVFGVEDDDDIRIYLGDGDDEVRVGQRSDSVDPPDDLEIDAGAGDDFVLTVGDINVADDLEIFAGPGDDTVQIYTTQVGDDLALSAGDGDDDVTLYGSQIGGDLLVRTGGGSDHVRVGFFDDPAGSGRVPEPVTVAGDTLIELGAGDDTLVLLRSSFGSALWADGGSGADTLEESGNAFGGRRVFLRFDGRV